MDSPHTVMLDGPEPREYGRITQAVMRDRNLSAEAKAIYAYLCSFAGAGDTAFPAVDLMIEELGMSRSRYYKHRRALEDAGLLVIEKGRRTGSQYENNVYHIFTKPQVDGQSRFGSAHCGKPENPQVSEQSRFRTVQPLRDTGQSRFRTVQMGYAQDHPQVDGQSCFGTAQNMTAKTGWTDGFPTNHPTRDDSAFDQLAETAVNRNRLGSASGRAETRASWENIIDAGFTADEVSRAWEARQARQEARSSDPRYFPQLLRWLRDDAIREIEACRKAAAPKPASHGGQEAPAGSRAAEIFKRDLLASRDPKFRALVNRRRQAEEAWKWARGCADPGEAATRDEARSARDDEESYFAAWSSGREE